MAIHMLKELIGEIDGGTPALKEDLKGHAPNPVKSASGT
jgi:hypothetical protein